MSGDLGSVGPAGDVAEQVQHRLAGLEQLPLAEHASAYDEVHRTLQQALSRLDEG